MENFTAFNKTRLRFGKGVTDNLGKNLTRYGKKALFIYGKKSIKESGLYNKATNMFKENNISYIEYGGIKSNPVIEDVDAAAELGRQNDVDMIIAIGGGSVIDTAKIVSITIPVIHSGWDFYSGKEKPKKSIPVIAVLTVAATGTEMNPFAVIQNNDVMEKNGYHHPLLFPVESYLDPELTYSVPADYTSYGITDLIAHCFEAYFGKGEASLSDRFSIATIKEAIEYGPQLMNHLHDYNLRAKIMYAATTALNQTNMYGKISGEWGAHALGHILSLLYDIPHGAALSIMYPAWMSLHKDRCPDKLSHLFNELFGIKDIDKGIEKLSLFFKSIGSPVLLDDITELEYNTDDIFNSMVKNNVSGRNYGLSDNDYQIIIQNITKK